MRRTLGVLASFSLLVLWGWTDVRGDISARSLFSRRELAEIPEDITVGVYYYPWHGPDFHRGDGYMRKLLDPQHRPTLGEYDDTKPETIAQHLKWSRQANVKLWVCSWWGPGSREDETIRNVILSHSNLQDHKIALLYETTGRVKEADGYDTKRVATDMQYICPTYFNHSNYYRIDGRPVLFLYLTRLLTIKSVLADVVRIMVENCIGYNVFIVGDQVWKEAPAPSSEYPPFGYLDGVTNYDIYGNMDNPPYAGQAAVDSYYNEQIKWRASANAEGVRYAVAASPGYNDRGVRFAANNTGLSRRLTPKSEQGTLFVAQLVRARQLVDPTMDNLLMVNSFNEWHEDTQIEPCVGEPTTLPESITNGIEYSGYGEFYLDILREATCDQKCRTKLQLPNNDVIVNDSPFLGSPPTDLLVGAYYYAWYGYHFNGHLPYLRSQLAFPQSPGHGEYDDTASYVIAEHLTYSRQANIGLWITRWVAPGTREDLTIRNYILPHPDLGNHLISLFYSADIIDTAHYSPQKIRSDVEYICDAYFNSPSYYHIHGRPVLFLYLSRLLDELGLLASVALLIRNVAASFGYDVYLVGDHVWSSAPPTGDLFMPFLLLDAVTNFDVYGNMKVTGYAGQAAVDDYYQKQLDWRNSAWSRKCGFIPGATPGFNNMMLKPLSRNLAAGDKEGSLFASSLKKARYLVDSNVSNLVVVNSFNNWFEDTQIEPVTGISTNLPLAVTGGLEYTGYGKLYLDILRDATMDTPAVNSSDVRDSSPVSDIFYPLQCNAFNDLKLACSTTWSSTFGTTTKHDKELVIPCGVCITMDHTGALALDGGLDIQGALVIPDGVKLELRTPYIRVQGELHANSTKIVDGKPNVKFTIWKGRPGIEKFTPADVNKYACGAQGCDPGSKSILVAGGKVNFHGLPNDSPTWVHLYDVVTDIVEPSFRIPLSCPTDVDLISERLRGLHSDTFSGTPGSTVEFTGYSLKVIERLVPRHGVQTALDPIRSCLIPGKNYTVSVQLRLNKDGHTGKPTECAQTTQSCLTIYCDWMDELEDVSSSTKFSETKGQSVLKYGQWTTLQAQFHFTELEVKISNIYLLLRLGGVGKGVDMELASFSLRLSPKEDCDTPDCRNLISCNGNADLGLTSISPVSTRGAAEIRVEEEDGNPFWRIGRLETTDVLAGIQFQLPTSCMKTDAVYRFRMKVRVYPDSESPTEIETGVYFGSEISLLTSGSRKSFKVGACPKSAGDWVVCEDYIVMPALNPALQKVYLYFETAQSPTVDYDIDDVSFEYLHMERPVTGLVVGGSVKSKWGIGAEIVITSYSLDWNGEQVRAIADITDYGVHGNVLIKLNATITRPPTGKQSGYAAEVALLSRNIVIEGARDDGADPVRGGHLMVYLTPKVVQVIEGVEFKNMGQQGLAGRYVSLQFLSYFNVAHF
jgi:glycoprotein endo-alpha-1,2-mannosidase